MTLSLNETETLCRKAARGAGMSWGLADEAGRAARWLEARGFLGARALAGLLQATDGADRVALTPTPGDVWLADQPLCPIAAGAAVSDHADLIGAQTVTLGPTRYPLLLLPFLAEARGTELRWDNGRIVIGDGVRAQGDLGAEKTLQVTCTRTDASASVSPRHTRCSLTPELFDILNAFAHRTYAPATEASRLAGAGAGLTDND